MSQDHLRLKATLYIVADHPVFLSCFSYGMI